MDTEVAKITFRTLLKNNTDIPHLSGIKLFHKYYSYWHLVKRVKKKKRRILTYLLHSPHDRKTNVKETEYQSIYKTDQIISSKFVHTNYRCNLNNNASDYYWKHPLLMNLSIYQIICF